MSYGVTDECLFGYLIRVVGCFLQVLEVMLLLGGCDDGWGNFGGGVSGGIVSWWMQRLSLLFRVWDWVGPFLDLTF